MKIRAFTLAEVLITLGIIGVVAAMTLPALTAKYQEKVLLTQIKRAYSDMENALKLYAAKNECSDITCISDTNQTKEDLTKRLYENFKGGTYCAANKQNGVCKYTLVKGNKPTNNGYGQTAYSDSFSAPFFVSAAGSAYQVFQYSECPRTYQVNVTDSKGNYVMGEDGQPEMRTVTSDICAIIYIDANGTLKGPNQFGADVYQFYILSSTKKLRPTNLFINTISTGKLNYTSYEVGVEIK